MQIRDLDLGAQFPEIKDIKVLNAEMHDTEGHLENIELMLDVQYQGNFHMSIDADMVLGKKGFLSIKGTHSFIQRQSDVGRFTKIDCAEGFPWNSSFWPWFLLHSNSGSTLNQPRNIAILNPIQLKCDFDTNSHPFQYTFFDSAKYCGFGASAIYPNTVHTLGIVLYGRSCNRF